MNPLKICIKIELLKALASAKTHKHSLAHEVFLGIDNHTSKNGNLALENV